MSTFSQREYQAGNYKKFRPEYPESFYKFLTEYAGDLGHVADLGCGTGQATFKLATLAKHVVGLDASQVMVDTANGTKDLPSNIEFKKGTDADLTRHFASESLDTLTAVESAHWFTFPEFYQKAYEVLKPNRVLAIWAYCDQHIVGYPQARQIIMDYSYSDKFLGKFWEQGRFLLNNYYRDVFPPKEYFTNIVHHVDESEVVDTNEPLLMVQTLKVGEFLDYLKTYSAYHTWLNSNVQGQDPIEYVAQEFQAQCGLGPESEITVKWGTVYILARRR